VKLHTHHYILGAFILLLAGLFFVVNTKPRTLAAADVAPVVLNAEQNPIKEEKVVTQVAGGGASSTETVSAIATSSPRGDFAPVSLLHFGDAMFDRNVRARMEKGVDPFQSLRSVDIMRDYTIRMLNLEGPIVEMPREKCQQKAYNFQFSPDTTTLLSNEGFTLVTIGNNHIFDCYQTGLDSAVKYLKDAGIGIIGYPSIERSYASITTPEGTKVALIGIDTTIGIVSANKIAPLIKKLSAARDAVIVSVHWGTEYAPRANAEQKRLAHEWIDAGASLIIGHHPHVIENMEVYHGKVIFYSLGNFIFDQIGEKENQGMGVGVRLSKESADIMLFPYDIINSVPTFKSMQDANDWCTKYYGVMPYVTATGCATTVK
jgi:poly-gamma-glutamate synthesis protein (capsule biosynthesis protein)